LAKERDELWLQFEALSQFDEENCKVAKAVYWKA
jgi:hypothetical protein